MNLITGRRALMGLMGVGALALLAVFGATSVMAAQPQDWQLGFQPSATPVKEVMTSFHNMLLWVITFITLFVLALLIYVCVKFNKNANPTPSKTSHNTLIEVIWTVVPVIILVVIAVPSFRLLYYTDRVEQADMTVKVTGRQWYWDYQYPDHGGFEFSSYPKEEEDLEDGEQLYLAVDNEMVIPAGATVRVLVAGADVLHSFFIPSAGVQVYTVPGRINETWMRFDEPGTYYGQCNQICGINHYNMPIAVKVVPAEEFESWVEFAQDEFADADTFKVAGKVAGQVTGQIAGQTAGMQQ
ncbi:MAG: cytochrome c oxidase subunit II [Alphaproteobacteria bacterium]|nr:cytochrome c oxidase subunit II [Alphaproteobacteria bacterium]